MKTLQTIAKQLLTKNRGLKTIVAKNKKSYKLLEPQITARLCTSIGRREGFYVQRNKLIWAIIDEANGTAKGELAY